MEAQRNLSTNLSVPLPTYQYLLTPPLSKSIWRTEVNRDEINSLSQSARDFLGIGWKFPVNVDANLMFKTSRYEQDIKEAIWIIIATSKGERIMRPDFGCGIHEYVFESISSATIELIKQNVRNALTLWEPRITIVDVSVSIEEIDNGKLIIQIDYIVNVTNNRFNLVYPFYLKEGG